MLGRGKQDGESQEIEQANPGTGLVLASDAAANREIFGDMADLHETGAGRAAISKKTVANAEEKSRHLMLFLQGFLQVGFSQTDAREVPRQVLSYASAEIAGVLKRFRPFGVERVRCYAKTGAGVNVAVYDIVVPTWNNHLMIDPMSTWGGQAKHWIGFRTADNGEIPVVGWDQLPVTSTQNLRRSSYHTLKPENFYWAKRDGFHRSVEVDAMTAADFLENLESMSEQLTETNRSDIERMQAVNDRIADSKFKALGAGPSERSQRDSGDLGL